MFVLFKEPARKLLGQKLLRDDVFADAGPFKTVELSFHCHKIPIGLGCKPHQLPSFVFVPVSPPAWSF